MVCLRVPRRFSLYLSNTFMLKISFFFRRWVHRAYEAAQDADDRQKVQEYIQRRMKPLIDAGTVNAVPWDREPLPHERNYLVPGGMWTPAAEIRAKFAANTSPNKPQGPRGGPRNKRSPSAQTDSNTKRGRHSSSSESALEVQVEAGSFGGPFFCFIQKVDNTS